MSILFIIVVLTLFISASCSLFEAVLYSTRIGTLEAAKGKETKRHLAHRFIEMKRHISEPTAAILILNTIANTAGATLAGVYAAHVFGASMMPAFLIAFTLGILFLSEILPKTIGAVYWRNVWPFIVWPLTFMKFALLPAIKVTQMVTDIFTRGHKVATITEDEILALVRVGAHEGEISHDESRMVRNIISLENKPVNKIMTPRTVIFSLDAAMTAKDGLEASREKGHSRIPVYEGDSENIIGYVMIHDLNSPEAGGRLKALVRPITFVRESENCLTLLLSFIKQRTHIAVVEDQFHSIAGLVTLEDLIETVLGTEIVDETDLVVDLQKTARERKRRARGKKKQQ